MPTYRIRQGTNYAGIGRVWRVEKSMFVAWSMIWYADSLAAAQKYVEKICCPSSEEVFYYNKEGKLISHRSTQC